MNARTAILLFLIVCFVLAFLRLFGLITPIVSGAVFALALVVLGGLSGGFRKKPVSAK